jgi:hypothetical protein
VKTLVVDVSVAAKWFLPQPGETPTDETLALLENIPKGQVRFAAREHHFPDCPSAPLARRCLSDRNHLRP